MPELPEVEAVVRKVRAAATGALIRGVRVLRDRATHPQAPAVLAESAGQRILSVERRGKNIVVRLTGGLALRVHLRMTGNLTVIPDFRLNAATVRVVFELEDGRGLVLDDARVLGMVHVLTEPRLQQELSGIGVDPLSAGFTADFLTSAARASRRPAKMFLMDQQPIAGLGNIYVAESLFRARIHPAHPVNELSRPRIIALHQAIRDVLQQALPDAIASYEHPGRHEGMSYRVYDREGLPCLTCGRLIARIAQGGRSTYYCQKCQKEYR